ncbi:hypothetical protein DH2020_005842 [Rehmannia glutinosa]|uniref:protein-serine/threonine phosphatase n=1 Tax=Rehmannia glutinosa TaxID=99300 RepID=A0ABR0XHM5_REHGL
MADVARARAYYSRYMGSNAANNRSSMERSRARRRRRVEMMRRNASAAAAANGGGVVIRDRSLPPEEVSNVVVGIPVAVGGIPLMPAGNGGVLISYESMQYAVPPAAAAGGPVPAAAEAERGNAVPVVGAVAVAGRQREMEDAVTVETCLCPPAINGFLPVHYFGVYDGHGGPHFAIMCKEKMHEILKDELLVGIGASYPRGIAAATDESVLQEWWRTILSRCYSRTEMLALHTCGCGSFGFRCRCGRGRVTFSGSTAVAVVLTENHIVVGNCGDSRAVLYRGGRVVPLTFDHKLVSEYSQYEVQKPDRADEKARIQASGGRVFYTDTARVEGVLAMSRAIGDSYLKPYVISEPEVTFTRRDEEDEFMILGSDGLWDVVPDRHGWPKVVRQCLKEPPRDTVANTVGSDDQDFNFGPPENEGPGGSVFPSRSASAASLLTRLAVARNSCDNICVAVVDLKRTAVRGGGVGGANVA